MAAATSVVDKTETSAEAEAVSPAGAPAPAAPAGTPVAPAACAETVPAAPAAETDSERRAANYRTNLDAMVAILRHGFKRPDQERVGLELERVLRDEQGDRVMYSGETGVSGVLHKFMELHPDYEPVHIDGHLMGFSYTYVAGGGATGDGAAAETDVMGAIAAGRAAAGDSAVAADGGVATSRAADAPESFTVAISLEPGAQVEISAGPAASLAHMLAAIDAFDAEMGRVTALLGRPAHLVGRGYDTRAARPEDVELIPKDRYRLMDDYLPRHGQCARDMMRCSTSTQVSIDYTDEPEALVLEKIATVLGPLFCFAFDNAPVWRAKPSPRMIRGHIWSVLDPSRCGIIPGSLDNDFTFERYCEWLGTVRPILMTDHEHRTYSVGDRTEADIMGDRVLTTDELMHLGSMVWPTLRLKGYLELREMDALPPALAVACASYMSSLFYDPSFADELPLDVFAQTEADVTAARRELEEKGWDATVYGVSAAALIDRLAELASAHARSDFDRRSIALLAGLWAKRQLPRDIPYEQLAAMRA